MAAVTGGDKNVYCSIAICNHNIAIRDGCQERKYGFLSASMDPLTHTATGLFLSRIGLKRWTPLATPILLLAANAPDIDIVTASGGSLSYLHYHRHLTHS